jgi:hypothetical protein
MVELGVYVWPVAGFTIGWLLDGSSYFLKRYCRVLLLYCALVCILHAAEAITGLRVPWGLVGLLGLCLAFMFIGRGCERRWKRSRGR